MSGSIGRDHLLRVRFPALVPGGLPVYQTATAVIGRPFGAPEADVAEHWWTLDNPANHWFGLGAVARAALTPPPSRRGAVALGVAEVITPDVVPGRTAGCGQGPRLAAGRGRASRRRPRAPPVRATGRSTWTPTCPTSGSRSAARRRTPSPRSCSTACRPGRGQAAGRAAGRRRTRPGCGCRPPESGRRRSRPSADLRGVRDLPVLIVAAAEPGDLDQALAELRGELAGGSVRADVAGGQDLAAGALADGDEAARRRGRRAVQPGHPGRGGHPGRDAVDVALPRLRRLAERGLDRRRPAGRAGRLVVRLAALVAHVQLRPRVLGRGGRLARGRVQRGRRGVQPRPDGGGDRADGGSGAARHRRDRRTGGRSRSRARPTSPSARSSPSAIRSRPAGRGRRRPAERGRLVTVRLRETDGRPAMARLRMADGIEAAWRTDLLEELAESDGAARWRRRTASSPSCWRRSRPSPWPSGRGPPVAPVRRATRPRRGRRGDAAGAGAAGLRPLLAAREGARPGRQRPGRGALRADQDHPQRRFAAGPGDADGGVRARARQRDGGAGGAGRADGGDRRRPGRRARPTAARCRYDLPANGFASWDVAARAAAGTTGGRYFVTARITDRLGQVLEDTALVTVGEAGGPDASLEPEELFFRLQSDVMALAGEADLELLTPELRLTPGASRRADGPGRQPPGVAAARRGPAGLARRHLADDRAVDAGGRGRARRRGHRQLHRDRPGHGRTRLGVLAAGQADVLRPGPLLPRRQAHRHRLTGRRAGRRSAAFGGGSGIGANFPGVGGACGAGARS